MLEMNDKVIDVMDGKVLTDNKLGGIIEFRFPKFGLFGRTELRAKLRGG